MVLFLKIVLFLVIVAVFAVGFIAYSIFWKFEESIHPGLKWDKVSACICVVISSAMMPILFDCILSAPLWYLVFGAVPVLLATVVQIKFLYLHGEIHSLSTNREGGEPC